jgi:ribose transport system substrate-binding protein
MLEEDQMRTDPIGRIRLKRLAGMFAVASIALAACSSGTASTAPSAAAPSAAPATTAPSAAVAPSASTNDKPLEIAYLSFAVANSYDAPMLAAAQAAAAAGNAKLTVFDANLDPNAQVKQLQDATASGKYDAIITQPLYGAGMVEDVKKAIAQGIAVGNIDQTLGADMTTADFQVDGLSSNVAFVPSELGKKIGNLVVTACADLKADAAHPCNVGYIWSVKAAALDVALKKAFDEAIAPHPEIKVVSDTGESFYTTALGLKAAQDIVAAHPDVSVIVSADQAITGAVQAVKDIKDKVRLVGYGGGAVALQGIKSGERFGTVMQMPATEGGLGTKNLIDAIRSGKPVPGVDPLASLPDGGVVTKANVDTFLPLAEWPG